MVRSTIQKIMLTGIIAVWTSSTLFGDNFVSDSNIIGVLSARKDNEGPRVQISVTSTVSTPTFTYAMPSYISSSTTAKQGHQLPTLAPLSRADYAQLAKKTTAQWHQALKDNDPNKALHAYNLCALPAYRAALKSALPAHLFKAAMRDVFTNMYTDPHVNNALASLSSDVHGFYYHEGMQAYAEHEAVRVHRASLPSERARSTEQARILLSTLHTNSTDNCDLVQYYQTNVATPLQLRDATLQDVNAKKREQFMNLVHHELVDTESNQADLSFINYYEPLQNSNHATGLTTLEALGFQKTDFLCVGNALQQNIHEALLYDILPKIVDASLSLKKENPSQHDTVTKILKQVVQSLHAALENNKDGNITEIHHHYAQAHDALRYLTLVQEGHRSLDQLCNKDILNNLINKEVARTARYAQHAVNTTLPSLCKDICSASCDYKELHCIARQNNKHISASQKLITTCADITRSNMVIASKQYAISPALVDAISASIIPLPALQHCTGTPLDHVLHQQAVEYMHEALTVMQEFKHPLLQAAYNVVDAAQRGDIKHAYYYLQQCGSLSDLSAINTYIPVDMFLSEHSLIEAATCKALYLVRSLPHAVQGARQSIRASLSTAAQTVTSPGQWPTKVGDTLHSFGQLATMTKDVVVDHTLASAAVAAPLLCATNMVQKAHQNKLDRYEKALALIEYGLDAASSMTAHEWGELGGTIAADCVLGKASTAATSKLWIASKHLASALKRSETSARDGNKLSDKARALTDRAHNMLRSVKEAVDQKPQATAAGVPSQVNMALMEAEQTGAQGGKKIVNTGKKAVNAVEEIGITVVDALNDIHAACAQLDPSIGDIEILEEAVKKLKNIPGAIGEDSPITRIFKCGMKGLSEGKMKTARGAACELKLAFGLQKEGNVILGLGNKKPLYCPAKIRILKMLDIDIETDIKIIECKNWIWERVSIDQINKLKSSLPDLCKLAAQEGKLFEFYSQNPIPETLKLWLIKKKIFFTEGL